jgi:alcohol dehydrogenase class IV
MPLFPCLAVSYYCTIFLKTLRVLELSTTCANASGSHVRIWGHASNCLVTKLSHSIMAAFPKKKKVLNTRAVDSFYLWFSRSKCRIFQLQEVSPHSSLFPTSSFVCTSCSVTFSSPFAPYMSQCKTCSLEAIRVHQTSGPIVSARLKRCATCLGEPVTAYLAGGISTGTLDTLTAMPYTPGTNTLEQAFPDSRSVPRVAYGLPFEQLCIDHIPNTLHCSRVYIIASSSLSKNTDALKRLQSVLGSKVVGTRIGMTPHTHWNQVLEIAQDAAPKKPDCIVTLGAGSLTDAAKVICWMLANEITDSEGMERLITPEGKKAARDPEVLHVAIPTSLSGGEYQSIAGVTRDDGSNRKTLFEPPTQNPNLVILDPELCTTTPERIWLSTGVRAVDHCVETLCSLLSNPKGDAQAEAGLLRLVPALIRTHKDPSDLDARYESMRGVIQAMSAVGSGVPMGGSHAIGHQLGPLGVGHGETSCIMLPAVCKWNEKVGANVERQRQTRDVLLRSPIVKELLEKKYGKGPEHLKSVDLGDMLDVVFRELGMPRTLKEVGVGRDKMHGLARNSLKDHWIQTNAKPITEMDQVLEILEMVAE